MLTYKYNSQKRNLISFNIFQSLLEPEKEEDVPENTEVNLEENEYDNALGDIARRQQIEGEGGGKYPRQLPPEPIIQYAVPAEPPSEPSGVGINKKVSFYNLRKGYQLSYGQYHYDKWCKMVYSV